MVNFEIDSDQQTLVCHLKGKFSADVNDSFAGLLSEKIDEYINSTAAPGSLKVRFDMKNTQFISSSFIRICMITSRKVGPGHFSIVNAIPMIKKTFKIAGLDREFDVR